MIFTISVGGLTDSSPELACVSRLIRVQEGSSFWQIGAWPAILSPSHALTASIDQNAGMLFSSTRSNKVEMSVYYMRVARGEQEQSQHEGAGRAQRQGVARGQVSFVLPYLLPLVSSHHRAVLALNSDGHPNGQRGRGLLDEETGSLSLIRDQRGDREIEFLRAAICRSAPGRRRRAPEAAEAESES